MWAFGIRERKERDIPGVITTCAKCGAQYSWNSDFQEYPDCPNCGYNAMKIDKAKRAKRSSAAERGDLAGSTNKIPCAECRALILPATSQRTGGLCMPCHRKSDDQARKHEIERLASTESVEELLHRLEAVYMPASEGLYLQHDWDKARTKAAAALQHVGSSPRIHSVLVECLADRVPAVRHESLKALHGFGWTPANTHETALKLVASSDWTGLRGLGDDAVEVLAKAARVSGDRSIDVLADIGTRSSVAALLQIMKEADDVGSAGPFAYMDAWAAGSPAIRAQEAVVTRGKNESQRSPENDAMSLLRALEVAYPSQARTCMDAIEEQLAEGPHGAGANKSPESENLEKAPCPEPLHSPRPSTQPFAAAPSPTEPARAGVSYACPKCGYHGELKKKSRGSCLVCLFLSLFYVIPGLVYAFIFTGSKGVCPKCGYTVRKTMK
jgi:predicted RNA-binding Zn-ribbon protein involved in translation (DUF1610 family)